MFCTTCKISMKHRDYVKRIEKRGGNDIRWIKIERQYCPTCKRTSRALPDTLLPFKQYSKKVILDLISNDISILDLKYEDYPCDMTITRWKTQCTDFVLFYKE